MKDDDIEEESSVGDGGGSVGSGGETRWVDGGEVGMESPERPFLRQDELRDGYKSMRRRVVKKDRRMDSFDVEAMEIAGAGAHHHSKVFLFFISSELNFYLLFVPGLFMCLGSFGLFPVVSGVPVRI